MLVGRDRDHPTIKNVVSNAASFPETSRARPLVCAAGGRWRFLTRVLSLSVMPLANRHRRSTSSLLVLLALCLATHLALIGAAEASSKKGLLSFPRPIMASFTLRGTNGYRISVSHTYGPHASRNSVTILVSRGNTLSQYSGNGKVSSNSIDASFGNLGYISVKFRQSGRVIRVPEAPRCELKGLFIPSTESARLGTFVGTFRFQGEGDYTEASGHRMKGGIGQWGALPRQHLNIVCLHSIKQGKLEPDAVSLQALTPRNTSNSPKSESFIVIPRFTHNSISANHSRLKVDGYNVLGVTTEESDGLHIFRLAQARIPRSDFLFNGSLSSATISPPAPFSGTGSFQRKASGSTEWTGSLSASLPGIGAVSLAGPSFQSHLEIY